VIYTHGFQAYLPTDRTFRLMIRTISMTYAHYLKDFLQGNDPQMEFHTCVRRCISLCSSLPFTFFSPYNTSRSRITVTQCSQSVLVLETRSPRYSSTLRWLFGGHFSLSHLGFMTHSIYFINCLMNCLGKALMQHPLLFLSGST